MATEPTLKVALLWRGNPETRSRVRAENNRLRPVFEALARLDVAAEPAVYADQIAGEIRDQLLHVDGVLVWVDPISDGQDRSALDALLREVSEHGVWVSAHPEIILKMGTKEVLYRTRDLGWGSDVHLYNTVEEFREQFPRRLASAGPRVLKQYRGNGGIGTFRVEMIGDGATDATVRVLEARRDALEEELRLRDLVDRCGRYFAGSGRIIDQAFQSRVGEGMVRCYLSQNRVVGFSTQKPRAAAQSGPVFGMDSAKAMYDAAAAPYRRLRSQMESEWVPATQQLLAIDTASLPVIWDADFLHGPKTDSGDETYVLCEINVSAVFPFPDQAVDAIARATIANLKARRERQGSRSRNVSRKD